MIGPDRTALLEALTHITADVIVTVDGDGTIDFANAAALRMFGTDNTVGTHLPDHFHPDDRPIVARTLASFGRGKRDSATGEWRIRKPDGQLRSLRAQCNDLRGDPAVRAVVVNLRDITDERRREFGLTRQASLDPLTGLPNRSAFFARATTAMRDRPGDTVVFLLGLDAFGEVNATRGLHVGDMLLTAIARRIESTSSGRHFVARVGGDEFAVLVSGSSGPLELRSLAEELLLAVSEPILVAVGSCRGTASVGVAASADADDERELLRQAELALRGAKKAGRGSWARYQPAMQTDMVQRITTRAELGAALGNDEFTMLYQPIVELAGGTITGFEALLRWRHPRHGLRSPADFIDIAEESGQIRPIGIWALEQAITVAAGWRADVERPVSVSVNVSGHQLRERRFADLVIERLVAADLPASRLVLELTESIELRSGDPAWKDLAKLRAHGIRVAIDDFGTGYSTLAYLQNAPPIDVLKVDRSFTAGVAASRPRRRLVNGIIHLAKSAGVPVVMEGVERREEAIELKAMGCQFAQGYYFAHPMTAAQATRCLVSGGLRAT